MRLFLHTMQPETALAELWLDIEAVAMQHCSTAPKEQTKKMNIESNVLQGCSRAMGSCGWVENGAFTPACDWSILTLLLFVIFRLTNGYCEFQRHDDMRDTGDLGEREPNDTWSDMGWDAEVTLGHARRRTTTPTPPRQLLQPDELVAHWLSQNRACIPL
jgi:hypothetical protein